MCLEVFANEERHSIERGLWGQVTALDNDYGLVCLSLNSVYTMQHRDILGLAFLGLDGFAFALALGFLGLLLGFLVPVFSVAVSAEELRANRGCDAVRNERVGAGEHVATTDVRRDAPRDATACIERRATRCSN